MPLIFQNTQTQVHSPTSAHPSRERIREVEIRGLKLSVPGENSEKGRELPSLYLHVAMQVRPTVEAAGGLMGGLAGGWSGGRIHDVCGIGIVVLCYGGP